MGWLIMKQLTPRFCIKGGRIFSSNIKSLKSEEKEERELAGSRTLNQPTK